MNVCQDKHGRTYSADVRDADVRIEGGTLCRVEYDGADLMSHRDRSGSDPMDGKLLISSGGLVTVDSSVQASGCPSADRFGTEGQALSASLNFRRGW